MAVTCCITVLFSRMVSELTNDALEGQEVSLVRSCVSISDQVKSSIELFFRLDSVLINNYLDCLQTPRPLPWYQRMIYRVPCTLSILLRVWWTVKWWGMSHDVLLSFHCCLECVQCYVFLEVFLVYEKCYSVLLLVEFDLRTRWKRSSILAKCKGVRRKEIIRRSKGSGPGDVRGTTSTSSEAKGTAEAAGEEAFSLSN